VDVKRSKSISLVRGALTLLVLVGFVGGCGNAVTGSYNAVGLRRLSNADSFMVSASSINGRMARSITTSGEGGFTINATGTLGGGELVLTLLSNGQVIDELNLGSGELQDTLVHGYVTAGQRVQVNVEFNAVTDLDLSLTWSQAGS